MQCVPDQLLCIGGGGLQKQFVRLVLFMRCMQTRTYTCCVLNLTWLVVLCDVAPSHQADGSTSTQWFSLACESERPETCCNDCTCTGSLL